MIVGAARVGGHGVTRTAAQLIQARPRHGDRGGETQLHVMREFERQVQAGQHIGVLVPLRDHGHRARWRTRPG